MCGNFFFTGSSVLLVAGSFIKHGAGNEVAFSLLRLGDPACTGAVSISIQSAEKLSSYWRSCKPLQDKHTSINKGERLHFWPIVIAYVSFNHSALCTKRSPSDQSDL